MLFDWLVTGQVVATNPAHAVRGPKHVVKTGKTTVLTGEQARELLDSIDISTLVGLRDRALICVMTFAFARIGAVVAMRVEDYYPKGKRWWVRLHEKGGKRHEMPAHHNLEAYLDSYIEAAGLRDGGKSPLFRSAAGRTGTLTATPMNRVDAWRMIQRRAAELGTRVRIGCHTFRATGITAYLEPAARWRMLKPWPLMKVPAPPSSMIAREMRSRSMRWSGLRSDNRVGSVE
jgi:integrase/recombinase XerD